MYNEKEDYKRDYDEEYRESDLRRDGWERVSRKVHCVMRMLVAMV